MQRARRKRQQERRRSAPYRYSRYAVRDGYHVIHSILMDRITIRLTQFVLQLEDDGIHIGQLSKNIPDKNNFIFAWSFVHKETQYRFGIDQLWYDDTGVNITFKLASRRYPYIRSKPAYIAMLAPIMQGLYSVDDIRPIGGPCYISFDIARPNSLRVLDTALDKHLDTLYSALGRLQHTAQKNIAWPDTTDKK